MVGVAEMVGIKESTSSVDVVLCVVVAGVVGVIVVDVAEMVGIKLNIIFC